jgi:hypothetical protein
MTSRISIPTLTIMLALGGCSQQADKSNQRQRPATVSTTAPAAHANSEILEEHWPDGTLRLRREVIREPDGTIVNNGLYTRWHTNGQKEYEAHFVNGRKNGTTYRWHRNGQLWMEENYDHGKKEGASTTWDDKGRKRKIERYTAGKPDGVWTVWDADGEVEWQTEFDHGRPVPGRGRPTTKESRDTESMTP